VWRCLVSDLRADAANYMLCIKTIESMDTPYQIGNKILQSSDLAIYSSINKVTFEKEVMKNRILKLFVMEVIDKNDINDVCKVLREEKVEPICIIESKNAYHIIFAYPTIGIIYEKFANKHIIGNFKCPIPGTYESGFLVKFIDF
jgi:hypothetical protein